MKWTPPDHAVETFILGPCYTLDQLLAVRREAIEECVQKLLEMDGQAKNSHNYYLHASLEIRKLKEDC